jgi:regulator of protease activity HflC (stomatin/prohibitin superfamily)
MEREMKSVIVLIAMCALSAITGCGLAKPDAGHEVVLVEKPMLFGHGGVDPEPVRTGLTIVALTTDAIDVDMQPEQYGLDYGDLMTADGVPLSFHVVVRVQVKDSVRLIREFGPDWYKRNVEMEAANRVRQAVRKHGMNETAISTVAIEQIDQEVTESLNEYIKTANLPVALIKVTVGKANPPDAIKNQRIETAAQQQRQLTEQQRKLAEDQRRAAELSRAEADNAYRTAMQLSPQQYLALETIKMQQQACAHGGCTFIVGKDATPVFDVRK